MPTRIFVDTAFVIALINHRDRYHQQASELAGRLEGYPLLVTDAVLLEVGNALARGYKQEAIAVIEHFLTAAETEIVWLTPQLFDQAFMLFKQYSDKEWSLVDCISFVAMREAGVNQALTFDRHFAQAGFKMMV